MFQRMMDKLLDRLGDFVKAVVDWGGGGVRGCKCTPFGG